MSKEKGRSYKGLALITLIFSGLFLLSGNVYAPAYSIYNATPYGASQFYNAVLDTDSFNTSRLTVSPLSLEGFTGDTFGKMVIIIGSERQYLDGELDVYTEFVKAGGTIFLFEDFGPARSIANRFGIEFLKGVLKETNPDYYTNSPDKPLIFDTFVSGLLGFQLAPLQLNRAAAIVDTAGFITGESIPFLVSSSESMFLDVNDNDIVESSDFGGQLPLGIFKSYGDGYFIIISDASLPLNQNWNSKFTYQGEQYDTGNAFYIILLLLMFAKQYSINTLIFDESHYKIDLLSSNGILSFILGSYLTLVYSSYLTPIIGVMVLLILLSNRRRFKIREKLKTVYGRSDKEKIHEGIVSRPTNAERVLSEQYILYKVMGRGIIHIAIQDLLTKIKMMENSEVFLTSFEEKYPDIGNIRNFEALRRIYQELHQYLEESFSRWL